LKTDRANLDFLRSAAVILVLVSHLFVVLGALDRSTLASWGLTNPAPATIFIPGLVANSALAKWGFADLGHAGVLLFFVHTSLVLMMSLSRMERADGRVCISSFYVRRLFRIYPLAILTVLVALAFRIPGFFGNAYTRPTPAVTTANLLLVQNLFHAPAIIGPMWSLPFEVQMYLALPFLYLLARRLKSRSGAIAIVGLGFVVWYVEHRLSMLLHYQSQLGYAPFFFMGIAAFVGFRIPAAARWSGARFVIALLALILFRCLTIRFVRNYRSGWIEWALFAMFALLLPCFRDLAQPHLRRGAALVARYSYGIYLMHVPVMWLCFLRLSGRPAWLQVILFIVLIISVPVILYHALEEPLIRVGVRLAGRTTGRLGFPDAAASGPSLVRSVS
jgi:peptidoglycan/LPS O-acetylase OafA/YrhL